MRVGTWLQHEMRFAKLKQGSRFDVNCDRDFIAVKRAVDKELEVVELTKENCLRIATGRACIKTRLHINDAFPLNLR